MKIAVFLNENKQILPFYEQGIFEVYSDEANSGWTCVNQVPFDMAIQKDLLDVQIKVKMLVSELEDSILMIVENIKGLPMALVQESGIGVWKAAGTLSYELFDFVKEKLASAIKTQEQEKKVIRPSSVGEAQNAEYEINLIPLLSGNHSLNSIDILVPFIKDTNFKKLQITCSHVPKWMKQAVEEFQLTYQLEELEPDVLKVTLNPAQWQEDISFRKYVYIPGAGGGCSCGG